MGCLAAYARYENGDVHAFDDADLVVDVLAPASLTYSLDQKRHKIGIVKNAAAATCYDDLFLQGHQELQQNGNAPASRVELAPATFHLIVHSFTRCDCGAKHVFQQ